MTPRRTRRERGAAAVEMAIILPLLLLFVGGIIDFGRFFYAQNITVNAAREGSRMMALNYTQTQANTRIAQAMIAYQGTGYTTTYTYKPNPPGSNVIGLTAVCPGVAGNTPGPNDRIEVKIVVNGFKFFLLEPAVRFFGGTSFTPPKPNGVSEMRCGG